MLSEPTEGLSGAIRLDETVPARAPWTGALHAGETLRIIDLEGNQAVDFLLYAAADDAERYSVQDTICRQGNIFLRTGSRLYSNEGRVMATVCSTSVAYHDTIRGGLQLRKQYPALWPPHALAACLRGELPPGQRPGRSGQARHGVQHQLVHERSG